MATPDLNNEEQQQAEAAARPNAIVVHEVISAEGDEELRRAPIALAWSALAAGLAMGFSLVSEGLLRSHLPHVPWTPLVSKLGYSVGFLIVVLGRQQLFTENTLTPVLPLLSKWDGATLCRLLRLWGIVLAGNLLGALAFAWVVSHTGVFTPDVRQTFRQIGSESMHGGAVLHLLRGIFAGWLIALMVWLLPGADQARVIVIFVLTYLVGLAGLSHVIAGSVEALYSVLAGDTSWAAYGGRFLLPTLLGNTVGGVALVAALNYGQVAPPSDADKERASRRAKAEG
jgi:formate/nitrite transporter FocA (FNT family)